MTTNQAIPRQRNNFRLLFRSVRKPRIEIAQEWFQWHLDWNVQDYHCLFHFVQLQDSFDVFLVFWYHITSVSQLNSFQQIRNIFVEVLTWHEDFWHLRCSMQQGRIKNICWEQKLLSPANDCNCTLLEMKVFFFHSDNFWNCTSLPEHLKMRSTLSDLGIRILSSGRVSSDNRKTDISPHKSWEAHAECIETKTTSKSNNPRNRFPHFSPARLREPCGMARINCVVLWEWHVLSQYTTNVVHTTCDS